MADWRAELQALVEEANALAKNLSVDVEVTTVSRADTPKFRDAEVKVKDQHDLVRENQLRKNSAIETVPRYGEAVRKASDVVEPPQVSRVISIGSQSDEIRQHVAKFKAHQQRLIKEREDFAARELKRMRASAFGAGGGDSIPMVGWYRVR
jgi:hypothetical protein